MSQNSKKDALVKEVSKFKFKEPKLRETILDHSVRCMTLTIKKQQILEEILIDEIQSIDLCVDKIYEIKRQLKIERQDFFRKPLTQARIKEKRKNDEHYDDFIKEYEEQESHLRDFELAFYNSKNQPAPKVANPNLTTEQQQVASVGTSNVIQKPLGGVVNNNGKVEKEKPAQEKKKEKKNALMFGKLIQKEPIFRMYKVKYDEDGGEMEEEIEAPSFKYKYLTKEQLQQQKIDNQPKKHNIPEKYCKCCNQFVRRHYCPHDSCPKPCIRQEKEKRLRQQYLDKNGGVRKQKKPLYKQSILANDISMARSAMDETFTIEQQQEQQRIFQMKILAIQQNEEMLKAQQLSQQNSKKKGRKPKQKEGEIVGAQQISQVPQLSANKNESEMSERDSIQKAEDSKTQKNHKKKSKAGEIHAQLDSILDNGNDKSSNISSGAKAERMEEEQQLLKQLEEEKNVQNILVGGSKIIYRNEDSSYSSSSSGISSGSSSEGEGGMEEE